MDERVADRIAIEQLVHRYCDAITRGDWDEHEACFAPDAVWEVAPPFDIRFEGAATIRGNVSARLDTYDFLVQSVCSLVVDFEGDDEATARVVMQETGRMADGSAHMMQFGVYDDRIRRSGDGWQFTSRRFQPIYVETKPLEGDLVTPRSAIR